MTHSGIRLAHVLSKKVWLQPTSEVRSDVYVWGLNSKHLVRIHFWQMPYHNIHCQCSGAKQNLPHKYTQYVSITGQNGERILCFFLFLLAFSVLSVNSHLQLLPDNGCFHLLHLCSQGHVYSLGSTLSAALNFVIEPELEAELGEEIQKLLEQMQEEKPEDRPLLQV